MVAKSATLYSEEGMRDVRWKVFSSTGSAVIVPPAMGSPSAEWRVRLGAADGFNDLDKGAVIVSKATKSTATAIAIAHLRLRWLSKTGAHRSRRLPALRETSLFMQTLPEHPSALDGNGQSRLRWNRMGKSVDAIRLKRAGNEISRMSLRPLWPFTTHCEDMRGSRHTEQATSDSTWLHIDGCSWRRPCETRTGQYAPPLR